MSSRHSPPTPDAVPPWGRVILYALAVLAPGAGVALGYMTQEQGAALFVTIMGALGPALAIGYTVKHEREKPATYRAGYTDGRFGREPDPELTEGDK